MRRHYRELGSTFLVSDGAIEPIEHVLILYRVRFNWMRLSRRRRQ